MACQLPSLDAGCLLVLICFPLLPNQHFLTISWLAACCATLIGQGTPPNDVLNPLQWSSRIFWAHCKMPSPNRTMTYSPLAALNTPPLVIKPPYWPVAPCVRLLGFDRLLLPHTCLPWIDWLVPPDTCLPGLDFLVSAAHLPGLNWLFAALYPYQCLIERHLPHIAFSSKHIPTW